MSGDCLKPFVFWGQNKQSVFLRVNVSEVQTTPEVDFKVKSVSFKCRGLGITGINNYAFNIDLLHPIDSKKSTFTKRDRAVELVLAKKNTGLKWDRVQESTGKTQWLKIDFDRFAFDTSDESEEEKPAQRRSPYDLRKKGSHDAFSSIFDDRGTTTANKNNSSNKYSSLATLKLSYLLIFNLFQFMGYSIILATTLLHFYHTRSATEKDDPTTTATPTTATLFSILGPKMMVCQSLAVLEIFHSLLKWVKSPPLPSIIQVSGRGVIMFLLLLPEERLHDKQVVYYLFAAWSAVEVIRYPYYILSLLECEVGVVTWLRYSVWIPLYPLGCLFEGLVMILSLPLLQTSERYNYLLPNNLNFHFHFLTCFTAYMICFLPGMYVLMNRMYEQRKKKLGGGRIKRE